MQAKITLRHEATSAMNLVDLGMLSGYHPDASANGRAVTSRAHQLDLDPVTLIAAIIAEERRDVVHVQH